MQNRFKSKALWLSIAALTLFVLKNWGLLDDVGLTADTYNVFTDLILAVLVGLGIINNPTNSKGV